MSNQTEQLFHDLSFTFEVHQEGEIIAVTNSGDRDDALFQAMAAVKKWEYGGNGPCQVYEVFTQRKKVY